MSLSNLVTASNAYYHDEFIHLHRLARLAKAFARLTGHSTELLCLYTTYEHDHAWNRADLGLQTVRIEQICGSEGRCEDYDNHFRPIKLHEKARWASVASAVDQGVILPPIEVVKVEEIYFVRDGHHRVSVAKHVGQIEIDAVVTVWQHVQPHGKETDDASE
ncbi:MAG: ParB N-terminal domain-containing protein [Caldilineaceae bacterium]|nr:ParB N-terminal domain-containing protein [Caldilineaceae bacterium]